MRLVIEDASGTRSEVPFDGDEITLGRAQEGNTFRLTERNVSRRHARFVRASGTVWIEDLGSLTGTRVNGEPIAGRRRLHPGDLVEIGGYDLALLPSHERPAWPPPVPAGARTPPPSPGGEASSGAAPPAPAPPAPAAEPQAPTAAAPALGSGSAEAAPRPPAASAPAVVQSPRPPTPPPVTAPPPPGAPPATAASPAMPAAAPSARSGARTGVLGRALLAGAIALLLGFGAGWLAGTLTAPPAPPRAGETPASR